MSEAILKLDPNAIQTITILENEWASRELAKDAGLPFFAADGAGGVNVLEIRRLQEELEYCKQRGLTLARELDSYRERRVVRVLDRLRSTISNWDLLDESFQQLKDDSMFIHSTLKGHVLRPSASLNKIPFLAYRIQLERPLLKGLLLAPVLDFPQPHGDIHVQLLSTDMKLVAESVSPLKMVRPEQVSRFEFEKPISGSMRELVVKIFVRNVLAPLRIYELKKYRLLGLGPIEKKIFCGLCYED